MKRSKIIFLIIAGIFLVILILLAIDIARRTTFPGSALRQNPTQISPCCTS